MILRLLVIGMLAVLCGPVAAAPEPTIKAMITRAGNADHDEDRLDILKQIRKRADVDAQMAGDLDRLIAEIDQWVNPTDKLYYWFPDFPFDEEFQDVIWAQTERDLDIPEDSPLYPLTYLYRARYMSWSIIELGTCIDTVPERRVKFYGKIRWYLEEYLKHYPDNAIAKMYLGIPKAPHKVYGPVSGAPEWAIYLREHTERLTDIIEWWIDNRQRPNGEFGGHWNDDVEMVQGEWSKIFFMYDEPKITAASLHTCDGLFRSPHMKHGYPHYEGYDIDDVNHSSEETSKIIMPMLELDPDSEVWLGRIDRLLELTTDFWTGINERGHFQFKSVYISPLKVHLEPEKSFDDHAINDLLTPIVYMWQRTGDMRYGKVVLDRLETYLAAAKTTEAGKPVGILPAAIHWPSGSIGGLAGKWWDPGNIGTPSNRTFSTKLYHSGQAWGFMMRHLKIAYDMTGEARYLEPIWAQLRLRLAYVNAGSPDDVENGSALYVGKVTGNHVNSYIPLYRELTGSDEFDVLSPPEPPVAPRSPEEQEAFLAEQRAEFTTTIRNYARSMRYNFEATTSECRHTDRLFKLRRLWQPRKLYVRPVPILSTYQRFYQQPAVRWHTSSRNLAAWVADCSETHVIAELFHFGLESRSIPVEFKQLKPGRYSYRLIRLDDKQEWRNYQIITVAEDRQVIEQGTFIMKDRRSRLDIELPSRQSCRLVVEPAPSIERIPAILDTDLGGDIDDIWAITLLLQCPEIDVKLITVSTHHTYAKAKVLARILEQTGRTDIPIGIGPATKIPDPAPDWAYEPWHRDYDLDAYQGTVYPDGAQAIVDTIMQHPGPITLIAIGPLPTVAAALDVEPDIAPKTYWVAMGGSINEGYAGPEPSREYNIAADVPSAQKVLSAAWRGRTLAPIDVAKIALFNDNYRKIRHHGSAVTNVVMRNYEDAMKQCFERDRPDDSPEAVAERVREQVENRTTHLWDTVAIYMVLTQAGMTVERLNLSVDDRGYTVIEPAGVPVNCGTGWTKRKLWKEFMIDRFTR